MGLTEDYLKLFLNMEYFKLILDFELEYQLKNRMYKVKSGIVSLDHFAGEMQ